MDRWVLFHVFFFSYNKWMLLKLMCLSLYCILGGRSLRKESIYRKYDSKINSFGITIAGYVTSQRPICASFFAEKEKKWSFRSFVEWRNSYIRLVTRIGLNNKAWLWLKSLCLCLWIASFPSLSMLQWLMRCVGILKSCHKSDQETCIK